MRPVSKHDIPPALPGCCSKCGVNYNRDYYIDVGLENEWFGVIYLCDLCFKDLVREVEGFYTEEDFQTLVESRLELQEKLNKLEELEAFFKEIFPEIKKLKELLNGRITGEDDDDSGENSGVSGESDEGSGEPVNPLSESPRVTLSI